MSTRWSFSLLLLAIYLAIFHVWIDLPRSGVIGTGLIATAGLGVHFQGAWRRGYFLNRWDAFGHASVILDVAVEGLAVRLHVDHSFYLCALAFVVVVGGYRFWLFRRMAAAPVNG